MTYYPPSAVRVGDLGNVDLGSPVEDAEQALVRRPGASSGDPNEFGLGTVSGGSGMVVIAESPPESPTHGTLFVSELGLFFDVNGDPL